MKLNINYLRRWIEILWTSNSRYSLSLFILLLFTKTSTHQNVFFSHNNHHKNTHKKYEILQGSLVSCTAFNSDLIPALTTSVKIDILCKLIIIIDDWCWCFYVLFLLLLLLVISAYMASWSPVLRALYLCYCRYCYLCYYVCCYCWCWCCCCCWWWYWPTCPLPS